MPKPAKIEIFEDTNHTVEFEENSEVKAGKRKPLTVRVTSGDNNQHKTGVLIRHFTRVDGIPMATFLIVFNEDNGNPQFDKQPVIRPCCSTAHSLRVIAWDRKPNAVQGADQVLSRRVRFKVK
jgi:hypothetical protein